MKEEIIILSCLSYKSKDDGSQKTRLGFVITSRDKISSNAKFKGVAELSQFFDGEEVFNLITKDMILKPIQAKLVPKTDTRNSLIVRNVIEGIECNGRYINLLQSK